MEIITYYRSEDGEIFDDMDRCLAHEKRIHEVPSSIHFYKGELELKFGVDGDVEDIYDECDKVEILSIDSWKDDLSFMQLYYGFLVGVTKPGVYEYESAGFGDWRKVE